VENWAAAMFIHIYAKMEGGVWTWGRAGWETYWPLDLLFANK
jgi:hypothetical protein